MEDEQQTEKVYSIRTPKDVAVDIERFAAEDGRKPGPWIRHEIMRVVRERKAGLVATLAPDHAEMNGVPIPSIGRVADDQASGFIGRSDDGRARFLEP